MTTVAFVTTIIKAAHHLDPNPDPQRLASYANAHPIGRIEQFVLWMDESKPNKVPTGWLECDGSEWYVKQWPALADVVQSQFGGHHHPLERIHKRWRKSPTWGSIPGYSRWYRRHGKFRLPDLRGRTMLGVDWGKGDVKPATEEDWQNVRRGPMGGDWTGP